MLIKVTYPNGVVQLETAFQSVAEATKALFSAVPPGVKIENADQVESPAKVDVSSSPQPEVREESQSAPESGKRVRKSGQKGGKAE